MTLCKAILIYPNAGAHDGHARVHAMLAPLAGGLRSLDALKLLELTRLPLR
jgi:hypothetical protein